MQVERLYMDNPLRNYSYLIICRKSNEALLIDPFDGSRCVDFAKKRGVRITTIINTHEHWDHIQGNAAVVEATGAKVFAHPNALASLGMDAQAISEDDDVKVGTEINLKVLDTPGHTFAHICLLSATGEPLLFCGDTLFNAGVGHCRSGGDPETLYETVSKRLYHLPDDTKIYPGHDYMENNLAFSLDRENNNNDAKALLKAAQKQSPATRHITTIGEEKRINPFFRLGSKRIQDQLQSEEAGLALDPKSVFLKLRACRDKW